MAYIYLLVKFMHVFQCRKRRREVLAGTCVFEIDIRSQHEKKVFSVTNNTLMQCQRLTSIWCASIWCVNILHVDPMSRTFEFQVCFCLIMAKFKFVFV